jgi:O-acetyl-ADP-ribose deacetylase (regulator of RNase III)
VQESQTIAFPAISCGVYGYPIELATDISVNTTLNFLGQDLTLEMVIFTCFSAENERVYRQKLSQLDRVK